MTLDEFERACLAITGNHTSKAAQFIRRLRERDSDAVLRWEVLDPLLVPDGALSSILSAPVGKASKQHKDIVENGRCVFVTHSLDDESLAAILNGTDARTAYATVDGRVIFKTLSDAQAVSRSIMRVKLFHDRNLLKNRRDLDADDMSALWEYNKRIWLVV